MRWFWTLVEIGGGIGLGGFLAAVGLDCLVDSMRHFVDEVLRLRRR
jgi:hypothetical protein